MATKQERHTFRNLSFFSQFLLVALLIQLASTIIGSTFTYRFTSKRIISTKLENLDKETIIISNQLKAISDRIISDAYAFSTSHTMSLAATTYMDSPSTATFIKFDSILQDKIQAFQYENKAYLSHVVIIADDMLFYDYQNMMVNDHVAKDFLSTLEWSKSNPYFVCSPLEQDPFFGTDGMVLPITFSNTVGGHTLYLVFLLQLDKITDLLASQCDIQNLVWLDEKGNAIIHPENLTQKELATFSSGFSERMDMKGESYIISKKHVATFNWDVFSVEKKQEVLADLTVIQYYQACVSIILFLLEWLLFAFIYRKLTKPLNQLVNVMGAYPANGGSRFDYPCPNEIGKLASTYNEMVDKINMLVTQLNGKIQDLEEEEKQVAWEQKQTRLAEIKALQAQINPHFLYNSLNAIVWMATDKDDEEVANFALRLADFYKLTLSKGNEFITLKEEMDHVCNYLWILQHRYSQILHYTVDIPEELEKYATMKIILQPLAENALYHGIKPSGKPGTIMITVKKRTETVPFVEITVKDNGVGIPQAKLDKINTELSDGIIQSTSGYGIYNINTRLRLTFGSPFGLRLESKEGTGTSSILTLPLLSLEEANHA